MRLIAYWWVAVAGLAACSDSIAPLKTAEPGVVFTYPVDGQVDVPLGTRIVVTFSDPVTESALGSCSGQGDSVSGAFCLVGPAGAVDAMAAVVGDDKKSIAFDAPPLDPGAQYAVYVRSPIAPAAKNLPGTGPLIKFTTRSDRPQSAPPALTAVNGGDPAHPDSFRPMFESSTIRLVFSEPLDPKTVELRPGSVELVEHATGKAVPATVLVKDIHIAIDPKDDLTAGTAYDVKLGGNIADLGGQPFAPTSFTVTPLASRGSGAIPQVLRTRQMGDPGPATTRSGADRNVIVIDKPLIGRQLSTMNPGAVAAELGDPKALDGPIAFTIRKGQRLSSSELAIKLGGQIPVNLSTGDIEIEFLTDAGGRIYRNPHQPADQRPENDRAPLYADLSFDVAVYAKDPQGNAVLTQTILGVQATGVAVATDGVLSIETVGSMEIGLLGVAQAPANLVLELITDANATVPADTEPPTLVASFPADGANDHPVGAGIDLIFSEPVDIDRLRDTLKVTDGNGQPVPVTLESHGSAIVVRPLARLAYSTQYHVDLGDVADLAGNAMVATGPMAFSTERLVGTGVPMTLTALHPGVPCALTGATGGSPGRCAGSKSTDDLYQPFSLAANEPIEADFSQPINRGTATLGACGSGSVRVEAVGGGACAPVPGTLVVHDRSLAFYPDQPWQVGTQYRLTLISGGNTSCDAGELCGASGDAASFDPLNGTTSGDAGGPNVAIDFVGAPASKTTFMVADAGPFTDINGSGFIDNGESPRDNNRAALRITGTSGAVGSASFQTPDCIPSTPETEGCMYVAGAMPVEMGELQQNCTLPGGMTAPACLPVTMAAQAMYATSVTLKASVGISITSDTGTSVMRIREPASGGGIAGYIIDNNGTPTLVATLDLYLDAPDLSLPLSSHDLHSKTISAMFEGPVTFMPDGRIAISLTNVADVPVTVNISAPLGVSGAVNMIVPADELKLQLLSRPLRGVER